MSARVSKELALLHRLARLYGVQTSYLDMESQRVQATPDSLLAVLRGLGAPIEKPSDVEFALNTREAARLEEVLEPVTIVWEGDRLSFRLQRQDYESDNKVYCRLKLESGEQQEWLIDGARLPEVDRGKDPILGHRVFLTKEVEIAYTPPTGYHQLEIEGVGWRSSSTVICAPRKAYAPAIEKQWGVFLPLYALHSKRSGAVADLSDLQGLIDWASKQGAGFVGTLPTLASFLEEPFDPSPYAPVSRLFWNELYIDTGESGGASGDGLVDYKVAMAAKRSVIEAEAQRFLDGPSGGREDFQTYLRMRPEVEDYARFRAATECLGPNWREWPLKQRGGELTAGDYDESVARYYALAQWRVDEQMRATAAKSRAVGTGLYLDMPVGVHALGYDAWRFQDLFASGLSVGAPPDIVTTSGQNWGFAPLRPEALRSAGYEYVRAYLQHHLSVAGMLRIDHVMGLHRLYLIPQGAGAKDGVYVRYPAEEMYAVHTLESHRNQAVIVGENLGIVPAQVNKGMAKHGIAGMYVMLIEMHAEQSPPFRTLPKDVVASFSTHDLPPFAAFWQDGDIEQRIKLGVLTQERAEIERADRKKQRSALVAYLRQRKLIAEGAGPEEIFQALLAVMAASRAERVLVNLEDLWLEDESQNVPGTLDHQHPNWRRRARYGLEKLDGIPAVRHAVVTMQRLRPRVDAEAGKPRLRKGSKTKEAQR